MNALQELADSNIAPGGSCRQEERERGRVEALQSEERASKKLPLTHTGHMGPELTLIFWIGKAIPPHGDMLIQMFDVWFTFFCLLGP